MRRAARLYAPTRMWDYLFLHGLALQAARHALRDDDRLYVPREWEDAGGPDADRQSPVGS